MGKRSDFKRRKNDTYDTPYSAFLPLVPHLVPGRSFIDPCAGKNLLIEHLEKHNMTCLAAYDIEPRGDYIFKLDALELKKINLIGADYIITNPAWTRQLLHPMIDTFRKLATTWLLFDSDWKETKQSAPYMPYCSKVVSVGRVSWMNNGISGKDNCSWYQFIDHETETIFKGRTL